LSNAIPLHTWVKRVVVGLALAGCGRSGAAPATGHPNVAAVLGSSAEDRRLELVAPGAVSSLGDSLARLRRLLAVGALDTPPEQVFGQVTGVALDEQRVFVLDGRLNRVVIFEREGAGYQIVGRAGQGPGEFMQPRSLVLLADQRLVVGDAAGKVHLFVVNAAGEYSFERSFLAAVAPASMCAVGGRLYVHGMNTPPAPLIYVYDLDGHQLAAFGSAYSSGEPMVDMQLSTGQIGCGDRTGVVFYASDALFGEVRAFDLGGAQRWRTWVPGFSPPRMVVSENGLAVELPAEGFDRLVGLTVLEDTLVALQVAHVIPQRETEAVGGSVVRITTIFIPPPGTSQVQQSTRLPRIGASAHRGLVLLWDDPFPRLEVRGADLGEAAP